MMGHDIELLLRLAKAEHDNSSEDMSREDHAAQARTIERAEEEIRDMQSKLALYESEQGLG